MLHHVTYDIYSVSRIKRAFREFDWKVYSGLSDLLEVWWNTNKSRVTSCYTIDLSERFVCVT